ncbi:hypothetical protein [Shewanella surugensis]|nr:hypothetical protein [Shewanella surugensis]
MRVTPAEPGVYRLLINMRPRKALNFLSPYEFLTGKRVSLIAEI